MQLIFTVYQKEISVLVYIWDDEQVNIERESS